MAIKNLDYAEIDKTLFFSNRPTKNHKYAHLDHVQLSFSERKLAVAYILPWVPGEFPSQRPVTRSFDVFFHLCLNKQLSTQSRLWWFETPSHPLWRHCNDISIKLRGDTNQHPVSLMWCCTNPYFSAGFSKPLYTFIHGCALISNYTQHI